MLDEQPLPRSHALRRVGTPSPASRKLSDLVREPALATLTGKLDAVNARFRDHTVKIFEKHHMKSVGYWVPLDADKGAGTTLIYILEHPSREDAKKHWDEFQNDPEWKKVAAESQVDGRIVQKVESVFMTTTDYSPMK